MIKIINIDVTFVFKYTSSCYCWKNRKCVECKKCIEVCPMNVDMMDNSRKRKNGTECILCLNCIKECKKNALDL